MSKNTRWALAIVGVVIIAVAAFVIGTGKDDTKATEPAVEKPAITPPTTGATTVAPPTSATGAAGGGGSDQGSGNGSGGDNTGGASPSKPQNDTGGASPQEDTGGAQAQIGVSAVLSPSNVRTITVDKGEYIVIRGRSSVAGEMHLHGYDKEVELSPGEIARIKIKATIDGEFPIEFHLGGSEAQVGTLRVNP